MIDIAKNEILFVYDSDNPLDRKALSYAKSIGQYRIKEFDLQENSLTETQLEEISQLLKLKPRDLVDKHSDKYMENYFDAKLNNPDARKVLSQHPEMIKTPIAVYRNSAEFIHTGYQFLKKGMS